MRHVNGIAGITKRVIHIARTDTGFEGIGEYHGRVRNSSFLTHNNSSFSIHNYASKCNAEFVIFQYEIHRF